MQLSLTNNTDEPEVIGDPAGTWTDALTPNTPYVLDSDLTVVVVGDKPDVRAQFEQGASVLSGIAKHLVDLVAGRKTHARDASKTEYVNITVLNRGANPVRVILGDGGRDLVINPGGSDYCQAPGYLEILEVIPT